MYAFLKHSTRQMSVVLFAALSLAAAAQTAPDLAQQIDAALAPTFAPDKPGAAVIVVKDGKTVFRKAYGAADIANKVAIQPQDVFRIGSITKQFTAVAIMMLADEGKLAVTDEITRFFPDYPTQGKTITVEHLLTHTSGIRSYTSIPNYGSTIDKDLKVNEIIDLFKNHPMDFAPGERYAYNNSGYFLLGAIVEKVSGMTYAQFVAERIFEPLGMQHTAYEGFERNGVKRITGYQRTRDGFVPARNMSMSQPYAAGSLVSNVDDLARWNAAIEAGKLLKPATWQRVFTPYRLNNGKTIDYGYGWALRSLRGKPVIEHGGDILGFSTQAIRVPESKVFVAVLVNILGRDPAPNYLAEKAAAIAMGNPFPDLKPVTLAASALEQFEGTYRVDERTNRIIVRDGDSLTLMRGGNRIVMTPYSDNEFFLPNYSFTRYKFVKDDSGKVKHMVVMTPDDKEEINIRTGDKPAEKKAITLAHKDFDVLTGEYQLAPNFVLTVSRDGDKYLSQATGQGQIEIFAESPTQFFVKVINAEITFQKDAEGKATGLILKQNGREMPAKKIR